MDFSARLMIYSIWLNINSFHKLLRICSRYFSKMYINWQRWLCYSFGYRISRKSNAFNLDNPYTFCLFILFHSNIHSFSAFFIVTWKGSCAIKRKFAAFALVLSWAVFLNILGRHPGFSKLKTYLIMFHRVMETFIYFMVIYFSSWVKFCTSRI